MTSQRAAPNGQDDGCTAEPTQHRDADPPVTDAVSLRTRLRTLRDERATDEREADHLPSLLRAIALTRRDRDASSSRMLLAHRAHLERVWAEAEDLVVTAAQTAVRVYLRGNDSQDRVASRAHRAIEGAMQALLLLSQELERTP